MRSAAAASAAVGPSRRRPVRRTALAHLVRARTHEAANRAVVASAEALEGSDRSAGAVGKGWFRRRGSRGRCLWGGSSRRLRRGHHLWRGNSRRLRWGHYLWRGGNRCATCSRGARRHRGRQALRQAGAAKAKQKHENPTIHVSCSQECVCDDHRGRRWIAYFLINLLPKSPKMARSGWRRYAPW
jgi:hypothetical protein